MGELFHASRGAGAWLGDERLPLRPGAKGLRDAIAGVDLKRLPKPLAVALAERPPYHSQRNFGSGTLEWCWLAAGRLDVYLHGDQQLWDYAAGSVILAEAGGHAATFDADDFWSGPLRSRAVVAALDGEAFVAWRSWIRAGR